MWNTGLDEAQAGIKIAGRNVNSPQIYRWHHPYGRKWRGTQKPLDESERGEWKSWLKTQHSKSQDLGIQSHNFMAKMRKQWKQWVFICLVSKIIIIKKSRDIILPTKVHLIKAMVFPGVMYGCELDRKAEHQRIDVFELWCCRKLLRVPWTARRSNQSILKEMWVFTGRTDAEAETQILWPPDVKSWLIEKDPDAGKDWRQEEKGTTKDEMVR